MGMITEQLTYYLIHVIVEIVTPSKYPVLSRKMYILSRPAKKKAIYSLREALCCLNARDLAFNQQKRTKSPWTIEFWSYHCIKLPNI